MLRNTFFILLTIINLNTYANDSQSDLHASYIFYYKNMAAGTMDLKMWNDNNDYIDNHCVLIMPNNSTSNLIQDDDNIGEI